MALDGSEKQAVDFEETGMSWNEGTIMILKIYKKILSQRRILFAGTDLAEDDVEP